MKLPPPPVLLVEIGVQLIGAVRFVEASITTDTDAGPVTVNWNPLLTTFGLLSDNGTSTTNSAFELVTTPSELLTMTVYVPATEACALVRVKLLAVAAPILVPLNRH